MKDYQFRLKCSECGKFIAFMGVYYEYTPYGSVAHTEPPESIMICESCFQKVSPESVDYMKNDTWLPLAKIENNSYSQVK